MAPKYQFNRTTTDNIELYTSELWRGRVWRVGLYEFEEKHVPEIAFGAGIAFVFVRREDGSPALLHIATTQDIGEFLRRIIPYLSKLGFTIASEVICFEDSEGLFGSKGPDIMEITWSYIVGLISGKQALEDLSGYDFDMEELQHFMNLAPIFLRDSGMLHIGGMHVV